MRDLQNLPENNFWYEPSGEKPVLIFVHGIFSASRVCWLSNAESGNVFWPDLVLDDPRLSGMPIFMGGYDTKIGSGRAEIRNCSDELFRGLTVPDFAGNLPPISKPELIFVCHSTGGIIVRYLLVNKREYFADKKIGLLLIASPSGGSRWAQVFRPLARLYGNRLFQQLEWDNWSLRNLDHEFKNLRNDKTIPNLLGEEACEEHFIINHRLLPNISFVVHPESACKYFGAPNNLPGTDHSTSVKPINHSSPSHLFLVDKVKKFTEAWSTVEVPQPSLDLSTADESNAFFYGSRVSTVVGRMYPRRQLEAWLNDRRKFLWWVLLGPGGSGKSRLALECAIALKNARAGFLTTVGKAFDWSHWQPSKDTFIIIDYASTQTEATKTILDIVSNRAASLNAKVRILLIDRSVPDSLQDSWLRRVLGEGKSQHRVKSFMFETEPITLGPLCDDDLWEIFKEGVNSRGSRVPSRPEFLPKLIDLDEKRRPLFALLAADAFANDRNPREWDADELLDLQLRYQRAAWEPLGFDALYQNVLVYATIIQYLDLEELYKAGLNEYFPSAARFSVGLYRTVIPDSHLFFKGQGKIGLGPLEPDLLGEFIVLQSLLPASSGLKGQHFAIAMWNSDGQIFATDFVRRAIEDFPDHPTLRALVQPRKEHFTLSWGVAFDTFIRSLAERNRVREAIAVYESASSIFESNHAEGGSDRMLRMFRAETAQVLCLHCLDEGNIAGAMSLYEKICAVAQSNLDWPQHSDYRFICAKSLVRWNASNARLLEAYSVLAAHLNWVSENKHAKYLKSPENARHLVEAVQALLNAEGAERPESDTISRKLFEVGVFFDDVLLTNLTHSSSILLMPGSFTWGQLAAQIDFYSEIAEFGSRSSKNGIGSCILEITHFDLICERLMKLLTTDNRDVESLSRNICKVALLSDKAGQKLSQASSSDEKSEFFNVAGLILYHRRTQLTTFLSGGADSAPLQLGQMLEFYSKLNSPAKMESEGYLGVGLGPRERIKDSFVFLVYSAVHSRPPNLTAAVERLRYICLVEPSIKFPIVRHGFFDMALVSLKDKLGKENQKDLGQQIIDEYLEFLKKSGRVQELAERQGKSVDEITATLIHFFELPLPLGLDRVLKEPESSGVDHEGSKSNT